MEEPQLGNSRRRFSALDTPPGKVPGAQQDTEPEKTGSERRGRQRVVVGMSGGVDSSVVAMLLQRQGYEVVGVFMRNWDGQDETGSDVCTADVDLEDARRVGIHLGITVETVDFSREYWNQVFEPSLQEFERCRTPNMDVACNRYIKFDAFREYALGKMAADLVATGHYARTSPGPGGDASKPVLLEAVDSNKDQTYFLCGVPSEGLEKVLFPLGGLTKPEVRALAVEAGLPVAQKRESMGVCFVGKRRSWADFISQYITPSPGNFVCADTGEIVGTHDGVQLYTVGQKSHLDGMPEKYYVAGLDGDTNSVIVARGKDNPTLYALGLSVLASEFNWVAGSPPAGLVADVDGCAEAEAAEMTTEAGGQAAAEGASGDGRDTKPREAAATAETAGTRERRGVEGGVGGEEAGGDFRCQYRCRHRQDLLPCAVNLLGVKSGGGRVENATIVDVACEDSGKSNGGGESVGLSAASEPPSLWVVSVRFDEPAKAIAPGQVVALYKDGVCLGGGPIFRAEDHCAPVRVRSPPMVLPSPKT
eukprot:g19204.t1